MRPTPEASMVLAKATLVAAEKLGVSAPELAEVLKISAQMIASLRDNSYINPTSPSGERAKFLIRLSQALSALCGDDPKWIKHFMTSPNKLTRGVPIQQISSAEGLPLITQFAESLARR